MTKGRPWPLGSSHDGKGVNFALFSANATHVDLCVFEGGTVRALPLPACTDQVWHGYLPDATPGLQYAYRVHGPDGAGHRFDPQRLLLDPYARELTGIFSYGARTDSADQLRACVAGDDFDWKGDTPPAVPWTDSVLYEIHVKGATQRHPDVPEALRGTYAGLASPAMIEHYRRLGITAVNLLPVHCFLDEERLVKSGRTNYWGYNTLAFFAPEPRYAARANGQSPVAEFKEMVRTLHAAGIEVILDVVYNHTAETDEFGPTVSFRGIDNTSYYRLQPGDPTRYENYSGCGNTFNLAHPRVLQLVMDSLRYWVGEMHVDGFRFDLASILGRNEDGSPMNNPPLLRTLADDSILSNVKLIAEAWDAGGLYQVGSFPASGRWAEWNGRYRDSLRSYLKGDSWNAWDAAWSISGSGDLYGGYYDNTHSNYAGYNSCVNFLTCHDGFTLYDLYAYNDKHNEANGWNNTDGSNDNRSWNCGEEGDSTNPEVLSLRFRMIRNACAVLMSSRGTPMFLAGDEFGNTKHGNNNTYCQDNETSWINWKLLEKNHDLFEFFKFMIRFRKDHPVISRKLPNAVCGMENIHTHNIDARDVTIPRDAHTFAVSFAGYDKSKGTDDLIYIVINAYWEDVTVTLPELARPGAWYLCVNTFGDGNGRYFYEKGQEPRIEHDFCMRPRSVAIFTGRNY